MKLICVFFTIFLSLSVFTKWEHNIDEQGFWSGRIYKDNQAQRGLCFVEVVDLKKSFFGNIESISLRSNISDSEVLEIECSSIFLKGETCSFKSEQSFVHLKRQMVYYSQNDYKLPELSILDSSSDQQVSCRDLTKVR